jgi:peptidoglycan/LPS O-acetylase OafA/YrhL
MGLLWTVSVEEQFYLLWPAFLSKVRHTRTLLYASGVLLLIATASRLLLLAHARALSSEATLSINTLARLDPFALGIATAVLLHNADLALGRAARLGLLATGCSIWVIAGHFRFDGLSLGFVLLGYPAAAVGAWFIFRAVLGSLLKVPRWLPYLGKISYGLYVFHELALYCMFKLLGGDVHTLRTYLVYWPSALLLTVIMAALSYRFFESPFLSWKERFAVVPSRPV